MVELVDSETDSEDESIEEIPVEKPVEPVESPVAALPSPPPVAAEVVEAAPVNTEETARKIKEQFRCSMARVMVQHLNPYRHPDAPAARITCTADFKHLARKVLDI